MKRLVASALAFGVGVLGGVTAGAQGPPMPQPAPEHALLQKDVGEWDAKIKMWMAPGSPAMESTGSETVRMLGGFWSVAEFEGSFMGQPFTGTGWAGWDARNGQYVNAWIDSTSPGISHGTATWDEASKTLSGTMKGPGPDGQMQTMETTVTYPDENTRVMTMKTNGETTMEITYTRKK